MKAHITNQTVGLDPLPTANFLEINKLPFVGVKEYLIPDTQRDAVNLKTSKLEAHNHCKNTSCTMALNWVGLHFGKEYPVLESLSKMNEFQYNAILDVFMKPGQRIQHWEPHVICFNAIFKNAGLNLKACFGNYEKNYSAIFDSIEKGFPVVLGTKITEDGHIVLKYRIIDNTNNVVIIDPYGKPPQYRNTTADYYLISNSDFHKWVNEECNAIWFEEF